MARQFLLDHMECNQSTRQRLAVDGLFQASNWSCSPAVRRLAATLPIRQMLLPHNVDAAGDNGRRRRSIVDNLSFGPLAQKPTTPSLYAKHTILLYNRFLPQQTRLNNTQPRMQVLCFHTTSPANLLLLLLMQTVAGADVVHL